MSYSRIPYIYSDGKEMFMDGVYVNEDLINILLYDLHKPYRKEELEERIKLGEEAKKRINREFKEMPEYNAKWYKGKIIKSKEELEEYKKKMSKLSKGESYENMWNSYETKKHNR